MVGTAGRVLGHATFTTTPAGYIALLTWMATFTSAGLAGGTTTGVLRIGVEGTGTYGAGLARNLRDVAGMIMVDVDHFKSVSKTFGHDRGDSVSASIAGTLQEGVLAGHLAVRLGGEELAVVGAFGHPADARQYGEQLRGDVQRVRPGGLEETVSIGERADLRIPGAAWMDCLAPTPMELSTHWRMRVMAVPRKYPDELRERAIRMAVDARCDPITRPGACRRIGDQLGIMELTRFGGHPEVGP